MYLNEYQSLLILSRFHFPVLPYFYIRSEDEMVPVLEKYEITHGVIQTAKDEKECLSHEEFYQTLRECLKADKREGVLVRPFSQVEGEIYFSVSLDVTRREHLVSVARGRKGRRDAGREIPLDLIQEPILADRKLYTFQKNRLFHAVSLEEHYRMAFFQLLDKVVDLYFMLDMLSLECNPLQITYQQKILISRVKMEIDTFALYRQSEMDYFYQKNSGFSKEEALQKAGILFGSSTGPIQLLSTGREFMLAISDLISKKGGVLGSYALLNEYGEMDHFSNAMTALLEEKAKVLLIVLLGGLKSGELLVKTVLSSLRKSTRPIVLHIEAVSMRGMKELLNQGESSLHLAESLEDAVLKAISLS